MKLEILSSYCNDHWYLSMAQCERIYYLFSLECIGYTNGYVKS